MYQHYDAEAIRLRSIIAGRPITRTESITRSRMRGLALAALVRGRQ